MAWLWSFLLTAAVVVVLLLGIGLVAGLALWLLWQVAKALAPK